MTETRPNGDPPTVTTPVVYVEIAETTPTHRLPIAALRPELHALVIGGGATGITGVTTVVQDGRSTTTIRTEDGGVWPQPSGDGARVVLRAALDPRAPAPRPCGAECLYAVGTGCTCECGGVHHGVMRLDPAERPRAAELLARSQDRTARLLADLDAQADKVDEVW